MFIRAVREQFGIVAHYLAVVVKRTAKTVDVAETWITRGTAVLLLLLSLIFRRRFTDADIGPFVLWGLVTLGAYVFFIDTPARMLHERERAEGRKAVRNLLGTLMKRGHSIPHTDHQAVQQWASEVTAVLDEQLGPDYAGRFNNFQGTPISHPGQGWSGGQERAWFAANGRLWQLQTILEELARGGRRQASRSDD